MSEFIVTSDVSSGIVQAGHNTRRIIAGEIGEVRTRLVAALERLNYHILSDEQTIKAKRRATRQVIGKIYNATVELTIALKPSSGTATQVTFDYEVASSSMYTGDHTTIEREVDAISALVTRQSVSENCHICGVITSGDSQFCRGCGTPRTAAAPAELEVLRLDAEGRYAHRTNIAGTGLMVSTVVAALLLIYFGSAKGISAGWAILIMGQIASFLTLFFGSWVLHRALNPKNKNVGELPGAPPQVLLRQDSLPPTTFAPSVTEGTTELLSTTDVSRKTGQFDIAKKVEDEVKK